MFDSSSDQLYQNVDVEAESLGSGSYGHGLWHLQASDEELN